MAMGLFDQCCTAETRLKHPQLYHATQKSDYFNHKVFWLWIANAIYHSVLLFWLPMWSYGAMSVWPHGRTGDYLVVGNIVYSFVIVTVCCKSGLEIDSWNWLSHAAIWGSVALWFLFLVVYSYVWPVGISLAANMAGMAGLIYTTPIFWLGLLLVPFTTLTLDVAYKAIRTTAFTTETDRIRIAEMMHRDVAPYLDEPRSNRLSEASSLLRNVRKVFSRHAESSRSRQNDEIEMRHGYAFSQEEGGAVSQVEYIRRYDTTKKSAKGGT